MFYVHGKIPWYPMNGRLGEPMSQSEFCGGDLLPLPGTEPPFLVQPACSLVTILSETLQLISKAQMTRLVLIYCLLDGSAEFHVIVLMKQRFTIYVLSITSAVELWMCMEQEMLCLSLLGSAILVVRWIMFSWQFTVISQSITSHTQYSGSNMLPA